MSRPDEIQELISIHNRRLQKLKEQQARYGISTPPDILIEIEDIEADVSKLAAELATLDNSPTASSFAAPSQSDRLVTGSEKTSTTAQTYYTYRIRVTNQEHVQVEKRDPGQLLLGEPTGILDFKAQQKQLTTLNQLVQTNQLPAPQVRELGELLFKVLFDPVLRQDFVNLYEQAVHQENKRLRIELDIDEQQLPEFAALPWEFMCLPIEANLGSIWLGTAPYLIFSRRRAQWHPAKPIQLGQQEKLRIALAVAGPTDLSPVEYQKILTDLEKLVGQQTDQIELLPLVNPANPETIDQLLEQKPHIFHFIGHGRFHDEAGAAIGQIALVDEFDETLWIDANYFSNLFTRHRPGIVLLQACQGGVLSASQAFTGVASRIVQQNIPVVVAMQHEVSNSTASRFARRFYQRLAQGEPVDSAAQDGRYSIALGPTQYNSRDFATPVIFMRVQNGHLFERGATSG